MLHFNNLSSHHKIFSTLNVEDSTVLKINLCFSVSSCVTVLDVFEKLEMKCLTLKQIYVTGGRVRSLSYP